MYYFSHCSSIKQHWRLDLKSNFYFSYDYFRELMCKIYIIKPQFPAACLLERKHVCTEHIYLLRSYLFQTNYEIEQANKKGSDRGSSQREGNKMQANIPTRSREDTYVTLHITYSENMAIYVLGFNKIS